MDNIKKTYTGININVKLDYSKVMPYDDKFYNYLVPQLNTTTVNVSVEGFINEGDREISLSVINNDILSEYILYNEEKEDVIVSIYCKYGLIDDEIEQLINGETISLYFEVFYETLQNFYNDKNILKEMKKEFQKVIVEYLKYNDPIKFRIRFDKREKENPPEVTTRDIYIAMKCQTGYPNYKNYYDIIYS